MGKVYEQIDSKLAAWLLAQPVFFVGTAPLAADGIVNVSPKGMCGCFAVLDKRKVAYLDYTGSGAETIAHLRENGRIVIMFCAFDGKPIIVRLHGTGRHVTVDDAEFHTLRPHFPKSETAGQRAIIVVDVARISDSCGWSVPLMDYRSDRDILDKAGARKEADGMTREYWATRNAHSVDGLPALELRRSDLSKGAAPQQTSGLRTRTHE
ncbi:pyridoxamine 5'-phosphate oxidase-related FMN- binding protein [Segniliparus rotundus DSM 44985]|uniref:Pyridoxamine 5'-phosphate oxidase-related FMN-binding protein n=1 Tax=Segniliparus rotundus (strain ATCC BAA-972 / CDC 1076 / CIP 108378 / DSM 44985 / JCM 13578) TaxID=640132 RepID=D6ZDC1_SEGRD|nr:pyridoxamine 5'-phosphate oxidase family protein [Segniliparus rotundus]ADG97185.1 pyridoxamine 5'-phosphate oxidase-related FMN- binding protein [Segniliparus rotundus DSM 44985]